MVNSLNGTKRSIILKDMIHHKILDVV